MNATAMTKPLVIVVIESGTVVRIESNIPGLQYGMLDFDTDMAGSGDYQTMVGASELFGEACEASVFTGECEPLTPSFETVVRDTQ